MIPGPLKKGSKDIRRMAVAPGITVKLFLMIFLVLILTLILTVVAILGRDSGNEKFGLKQGRSLNF